MGLSVGVKEVLMLLAFAIEVIAGGAYFNSYYSNSEVKTGRHLKAIQGWYLSYSVFCFGLISLIFAVFEIGLVFFPQYFKFVDSMMLRSIIYILKGIATLGVSGDLGIAAGALELAIGAAMLIYSFITDGVLSCKK